MAKASRWVLRTIMQLMLANVLLIAGGLNPVSEISKAKLKSLLNKATSFGEPVRTAHKETKIQSPDSKRVLSPRGAKS